MVRVALQLRARLDGVTRVQPADDPEFRWYLRLRCVGCGHTPEHFQYASLAESCPLKGGRGQASVVARCKMCARDNSLDIVADSVRALNADEQFETVVVFECRGVEPHDFSPRIDWRCVGADSATEFVDVDLSEKEWVDYDERAARPVGIYDLQWRFVKVKH